MAMSGGLDSCVAAMMLHRQGYEIVGITMKTWDYADAGSTPKETGCCSLDSINDARQMAVSMGFPHYVVDIREEFERRIISDFVDQYMKGRTPNPCVLCNTHIKWAALLNRADKLGCQYIATGHYARVRQENERMVLSKGVDDNKDQSYVLWGLTQDFLKRSLFPLGAYTKDQVREMAIEEGFQDIAGKRESYEICFIPDDDYRRFLKHRIPDLEKRFEGGDFVDSNGNLLGKHKGYPFYTIGQRKGLNLAMGEPVYVQKIIPESNTIVVGSRSQLYADRFAISGFNHIKYSPIPEDIPFTVKIRYKDAGHPATVSYKKELIDVRLLEPVAAITPGQSAVIYEGSDVVGGGFIEAMK